jgi:hypothetical protein
MIVKRFRDCSFVVVLGICIIFLQWDSLSCKIVEIDPEEYQYIATDLQVSDARWDYSYITAYHGSFLVKARRVETVPFSSRAPATDHEVHDAMRRELRLVPAKLIVEAAYYLTVLLTSFFLCRWTRRRIAHSRNRAFRLVPLLYPGAVFWTLATLPLALSYGNPVFSRWIGPGCLSYSFDQMGSPGPGLTVSYRPLVEMISLPLILITRGLRNSLSAGAFYVGGWMFYGCVFAFFLTFGDQLSKRRFLARTNGE